MYGTKNSALDTLVVVTNSSKPKNIHMRTFVGLGLVVRGENEFSEESKEMLQFENKCADLLNMKLSPETVKSLLRSHNNITIISASCVRSKGFGTKENKIYHTPCILLCCPVKGIIPAEELPFPSTLEGHEVDIREATCMFAANDEPLCVGDEIRSANSGSMGTLGGFVDLQGGCSKGLITCAHVVFKPGELRLKDFGKLKKFHRVYTEITDENGSHIGVVERAVFKDDKYDGTSVDAALIEIPHSIPVDGSFSKKMRKEDVRCAGFFNESPHFSYGGIESVSFSNIDSKIVKMGAVSGLTSGRIKFTESIFRSVSTTLSDKSNVTFRGQIEIMPDIDPTVDSNDRPPFLSSGDSGSFVFMVTRKNPLVLKCIGMAISLTSFGTCFVTPIVPILEALELPLDCLAKFRDLPEEEVDIRSFLVSIKSDVNQIRSEINTNLNDIKSQLASQDQKIRRLDSERTKCSII
ncbi:uncharacterized protein LOC134238966 [Saccostrea cucullata]|uniref:uncharacterized protein LOC134238966 n=1 Tax=Saccostrea cuccullata TaxID=36930 RepID=UPI002ED15B15